MFSASRADRRPSSSCRSTVGTGRTRRGASTYRRDLAPGRMVGEGQERVRLPDAHLDHVPTDEQGRVESPPVPRTKSVVPASASRTSDLRSDARLPGRIRAPGISIPPRAGRPGRSSTTRRGSVEHVQRRTARDPPRRPGGSSSRSQLSHGQEPTPSPKAADQDRPSDERDAVLVHEHGRDGVGGVSPHRPLGRARSGRPGTTRVVGSIQRTPSTRFRFGTSSIGSRTSSGDARRGRGSG